LAFPLSSLTAIPCRMHRISFDLRSSAAQRPVSTGVGGRPGSSVSVRLPMSRTGPAAAKIVHMAGREGGRGGLVALAMRQNDQGACTAHDALLAPMGMVSQDASPPSSPSPGCQSIGGASRRAARMAMQSHRRSPARQYYLRWFLVNVSSPGAEACNGHTGD
jgi:hypothetical protein